MAKIDPPFDLTGRWAGLSVYHLRGVGLVGRRPWGPTSKDLQTRKCYDLTRRITSEHGACSMASKWLRKNFHPLEPARDYSMSGPVTGWLKDLLPLDGDSEYGHRHVLLSRGPYLLEGINLSKRHPFDSVVRGGITHRLDRAALRAAVQLPPLQAGVSFTPTGRQPYFKVVATLGLAPDLLWDGESYGLDAAYQQCFPVTVDGGWTPTAEGSGALDLELQLPSAPPNDHFALVLTLGVLMGTAGRRGELEAVKYAGCAKVLAAV